MASGLARRIAGRSAAFYAATGAAALLPLASVPYLTRTLGPEAWGELAIAQAVATVLAVLVDYGHAQSATRALLHANDPAEARRIATTILASKLVLAVAGGGILAFLGAVDLLRIRGDLLAAAIVAGSAQGLWPLWLIQAGGRIVPFLLCDIVGKASSVGALFLLVCDPAHAPRVLWLQAAAAGISFAVGFALAGIRPKGPVPRVAEIWRALRKHRHGFLFRATILGYTTTNVLVLGLVAPAHEVGLFAAADRTVRLVASFAVPLGQALYPLLARSWREDPLLAARLAARATLVVTGVGLALGLGIYFAADPIIRVFLGGEFSMAAVVLRILAPLPPLICVSNILGLQWMFAIGAEKAFVKILAIAATACVSTGAILAPTFGASGMSVAATLAEGLVTGGILLHLLRTRRLPSAGWSGIGVHAH